MRVDTLLVRYRNGYREVSDFGLATEGGDQLTTNDEAGVGTFLMPEGDASRIEGFVNYPEDTAAEADRKALATIAKLQSPRWLTRAGIEPTGTGDVPFTDWDVADTITLPDQDGTPAPLRVVGLLITEDEAGNPVYRPEVGDPIPSTDERQAVVNRSMSAGTVGGRDPQAMPVTSAASRDAAAPRGVVLPPWSLAGPVFIDESGRYYPSPTTIRSVRASLLTAGTSTTTVAIKVNGVQQDTIDLTTGVSTNTKAVEIAVAAGAYVSIATTAAGTGAEDLTVQLS